jgi:membrane-bound serine protease (ClpP class)
VGGALCLLLGGILLINPAEQPFYMNPGQTLSLKILIPIILTFVLIFFYLGYYVLRAQQHKNKTGIEGMIGLIGEAKTEINPHGGQVFIRGELWKAVSQEIIIPGAKVEVIDVEGLMLQVQLKK